MVLPIGVKVEKDSFASQQKLTEEDNNYVETQRNLLTDRPNDSTKPLRIGNEEDFWFDDSKNVKPTKF